MLGKFSACAYSVYQAFSPPGRPGNKATVKWSSQFSLQHGLVASVGIVLGKAECCRPSLGTVKDRERVLHASLRQSTWKALSRCHNSSHTVNSIITSYCLARFIQKWTG